MEKKMLFFLFLSGCHLFQYKNDEMNAKYAHRFIFNNLLAPKLVLLHICYNVMITYGIKKANFFHIFLWVSFIFSTSAKYKLEIGFDIIKIFFDSLYDSELVFILTKHKTKLYWERKYLFLRETGTSFVGQTINC